jgi:basic membrane protein A
MKRIALGLMAATAMSVSASAEPAIVYDLGSMFDKSFAEAALVGAEKFKAETGASYREFAIRNDAQREPVLRKFARDGNSPVVVTGFAFAPAIETVAKEFPGTDFGIIDSVVEAPNVQSVVFKDQEGAWLVGVMAAKASKTGTVGFVGGLSIPLIARIACGYLGGVKSVIPDATVIESYVDNTPAPWNDPVRGGQVAREQIARGADVIFHAAGNSGVGVLRAAAEAGKLGIGAEVDQNGLQPGHVLTSMLKRVDVAVYNVFKAGADGTFRPGIRVLGLAENGIGYAMDANNKPLVTDDMLAAVEDARARIVSGEIEVHDFIADNSCPY